MLYYFFFFFRLHKIGSNKSTSNVFGVAVINGFCCLVTVTTSAMLSISSTRPVSTVTMEETLKCKVIELSVSPDGKVAFLLDQGVGQLTRVETATGNCRSLGRELSCNASG